MIKTPVVNTPKGEGIALPVVDELKAKGCAVPDVERIIYNRGTKKAADGSERPTLATVVYFVDGSKVTVVNSEHDGLQLDADGKPTRESKERGLIYALVKRIYASEYVMSDKGELKLESKGFGRILNEFVDSAYDQQEEDAKRKAAEAAAKAEFEAKKGTSKRKRAALGEVVVDLSESVKDMKDCIAALKADLDAMRAAR